MAPMMGIQGVGARLQRIGNIKIGKKGPTRKGKGGQDIRLPVKHEYFTVTTMERDKDQDWIADDVAMKELGERPTEIPVFVPYDRIDLIVPHELAHWSASKRHCHGNRIVAEETDEKTGEITSRDCPCEKLNKECKPHVILNVMLELGGRIGGVHQLRTGSWNSLENILASLNLIKSITGGPVAGLPLTMTIRPQQATVKGKKQKIYVVGLEFRANPHLKASAVQQMQEIAGGLAQVRLTTGQDMLEIEKNAASLNEEMLEDRYDRSEEFVSSEDHIDRKTASKTADLRKGLKNAQEKKEPEEPSEEDLMEQLHAEISMLLENPALPDSTVKEWKKWLKKKLILKNLQDGRDKIGKLIEQHEKADKESAAPETGEKSGDGKKETGRPSLRELTSNLNDLMGNAKEEGLVTETEYQDIFNAADANQNVKWLTNSYNKWEVIIKDRRKIREAEKEEAGLKPGEQGKIA